MILVTGGAGFIGSVLVWELNRRGVDDILIVDHLGTGEKWRNLSGLSFYDVIDKSDFLPLLESGKLSNDITAVYHLGACSSTSESDATYLLENNYRYSVRLGEWWATHPNVRFVYASSAATYGDGTRGYVDSYESLGELRPLNMYGYSKHLFDMHAQRHGWLKRAVGLKFFNVFGPNEYHKGAMRSLLCKAFESVLSGNPLGLFKSHLDGYSHGEQIRDFVYVKDAVAVALALADNKQACGLYNVGTGTARSWNDVGRALFAALGREPVIEYVDMPVHLQGKYQYRTEADTTRLRTVCGHAFLSLEAAVDEYVKQYLSTGATVSSNPHRSE